MTNYLHSQPDACSMESSALLEEFDDKLSVIPDEFEKYVFHLYDHPITFVAFYPDLYTEYFGETDGYGCVFAFWRPHIGFGSSEILFGCIKFVELGKDFIVSEYPAIRTKRKKLKPHITQVKKVFLMHLLRSTTFGEEMGEYFGLSPEELGDD